MKKPFAALAVVFALGAAQAAHAQTLKGGAIAVGQTEAVVTVTKVDADARTVTFRGPKGGVGVLNVPAEAQNLDQVKPGQRYRMKYVEALALTVEKGGKPSAGVAERVTLAPKGAKPGGISVRSAQISGVIDAIDYTDRYLALRGPKGNTLVFRAADEVNLDALSAGDRITLTYTEALAIEMVPQGK
jgi:Cu/Ag efflux protein CusF